MNESAPVLELIVNLLASAPPAIEYACAAPASGSVAVTVVTVAVFSATLTAAVAPPPFDVIAGGSLTLVTVTAIACVSVVNPSDTWTMTSYTLLAPASVGASKLGAVVNDSAPVVELIVNCPASAP